MDLLNVDDPINRVLFVDPADDDDMMESMFYEEISTSITLGDVVSCTAPRSLQFLCAVPHVLRDCAADPPSPLPQDTSSESASKTPKTPEIREPSFSPDIIIVNTQDSVRRHIYQYAGRKPFAVDSVAKSAASM
jgi:hypothetical protein